MGTAHAIGIADGHFDEPFMCVNGDVVIFDSDIGMMLSKHHENGSPVIGAVEVSDPQRFGVLETVNGKLDRIVEKPSIPTSNLINAGVFVFDPEIFDQIRRTEMSPRGEYEITDTLNALAKKKGHARSTAQGGLDRCRKTLGPFEGERDIDVPHCSEHRW